MFEMTISDNHNEDTIIGEVTLHLDVDISDCKESCGDCKGTVKMTLDFRWKAVTTGTEGAASGRFGWGVVNEQGSRQTYVMGEPNKEGVPLEWRPKNMKQWDDEDAKARKANVAPSHAEWDNPQGTLTTAKVVLANDLSCAGFAKSGTVEIKPIGEKPDGKGGFVPNVGVPLWIISYSATVKQCGKLNKEAVSLSTNKAWEDALNQTRKQNKQKPYHVPEQKK